MGIKSKSILFTLIGLWCAATTQATPPLLHVSTTNSRYFTNDDVHAVYLTGEHNPVNMADWSPVPPIDFTAVTTGMQSNNQNFLRLWALDAPRGKHLDNSFGAITPVPFNRSSTAGEADGGNKFDLSSLNSAYFTRLRNRVIEAGNHNLYAGVMLTCPIFVDSTGMFTFSFYNRSNNVNVETLGIANTDQYTLNNGGFITFVDAYIDHVVDTLNDLDNVLYEVGNEGPFASNAWQEHVIDRIHARENSLPKKHPVGKTGFDGNTPDATQNSNLLSSHADWVSLAGRSLGLGTVNDALGGKPDIYDTDHIVGFVGTTSETAVNQWVWRSLLKGHNPIFIDVPAGYPWFPSPAPSPCPCTTTSAQLGYSRKMADRCDLVHMTPSGSVNSNTGYAMAKGDQSEFLFYQPSAASFTLKNMPARQWTAEWMNTSNGVITGPVSYVTSAGDNASPAGFTGGVLHLTASSPVIAQTYYISSAGSDQNNGKSISAPWLHAPAMGPVFNGTYTHQSGDRFIFCGGGEWFNPLMIDKSGSSGSSDYYGYDRTWFVGSSFTRPKINGNHTSHQIIGVLGGTQNVLIDGLEVYNAALTSATYEGCIAIGDVGNVVINDCYVHKWDFIFDHDSSFSGGIVRNSGSHIGYVTVQNCIIKNDDGNQTHGFARCGACLSGIDYIYNCELAFASQGLLHGGLEFAHNYVHDLTISFDQGESFTDSNHNGQYDFGEPFVDKTPFNGVYDAGAHDNTIYWDSGPCTGCPNSRYPLGVPMQAWGNRFENCDTSTGDLYTNPRTVFQEDFYAWDNFSYNTNLSLAFQARCFMDIDSRLGNPSQPPHIFCFNNTVVRPDSDFEMLRAGGVVGFVEVENNHFIMKNTSASFVSGPVDWRDRGHNKKQTLAQANAQGYTLSNLFRATDSGDITVGAGVVIADPYFSTDLYNPAVTLMALDYSGATRVAPIDAGAHEFGGATPSPTPAIILTTTSINFGSVELSTNPPDINVPIKNNGSASGVASFSLSAPYSLPSGPNYTVGAGATVQVPVRYRPTVKGVFTSSLSINGTTTNIAGIGTPNLGTANPSLTVAAADAVIIPPFTNSAGDISQPSQTALTDGGQLRFFATIPAGQYTLSYLVNAPSQGANSFGANFDTFPTDPTMVADIQPLTSGFESRGLNGRGTGTDAIPQFIPRVFTLANPSKHEFILAGREGGTLVRQITISPQSTPPPALSVSITAIPAGGPEPLHTVFTSTPAGGVPPYFFAWNFQDGGTSALQNPSHNFAAGTYPVSLTVTDSWTTPQTASAVTAITADALAPIDVIADAVPTSGTAPLSVDFTAVGSGGLGPYFYHWTFSDGGSSDVQNPTHVFLAAGSYVANCTITDSASPAHTFSDTVTVTVSGAAPPLTVSISGTPQTGTVPFSVTFTLSVSGGTGPYTTSLTPGDLTPNINGSLSPTHVYSTAGSFSAVLTARDSLGAIQTANIPITANAAPPTMTVSIYASSDTGVKPLTVSFLAIVNGGDSPYGYLWDFGDGTTSTEAAPVHVFTTVGENIITLTVTDAHGMSISQQGHVTTTNPTPAKGYIILDNGR